MSVAEAAPHRSGGPGRAFWLVGAAVAAFGLFLLALAFPPDLGGGDGGAHALSRSPVGYAGAVRLLRARGTAVSVLRTVAWPAGVRGDALLVLTPTSATSVEEILSHARGRRTLVIPPKWIVAPDPRRRGGMVRLGEVAPAQVLATARGVLGPQAATLVVASRAAPALAGVANEVAASGTLAAGPIDRLRTLSGQDLRAVFTDARGRTLIARADTRPLYLLSDPDLLDNHGVADLRTARAGVGALAALADGAPVLWDVTLDGLAAAPPAKSPLKALFLPPFLPGTLCVFVAAALTGLAARGRFGALAQAERAYGFGKRALADSAASLFALAGREPALAPRYAELAREAAAAAASLGPDVSRAEGDAALDRIGAARGLGGWTEVAAAAQGVTTVRGLLVAARRAHEWRRGMTGGRR